MKIAITGASGNVGRQALAAFEDADHEITPITHDETEDIEGRIADVTDYESVSDALSGQDVAIHLAANPSPEAEWEDVLGVNVDGTYNVYEAAVDNDLDRLVFASTNHVSNMYNAASPDERESLIEDPDVIDPDDPPRPDSYYGVSKVAGEALGSYYADLHGLEVVNLRIGWLMDRSDLKETQDDTERRARFARAMWLSPGDCRNAIRGATLSSLSENPVTVNVVSANDDRYLSLTHTIRGIDYRPRDNATEALGGDAR